MPLVVSCLRHLEEARVYEFYEIHFDYNMQSLVALSATQLAFTVKSAALDQIAFAHRGKFFNISSQAVGNSARKNSDAVLAVSAAMLSWQSPGWRAWAALMQGLKTLKNTLQP